MSAEQFSPRSRADFDSLVAPHQSALLAQCYRMTGSLPDAEDALQETLLRAWRGIDDFEGRSSVRTWLFRIATNASLRLIEQRRRRVLPADLGPPAERGSEAGRAFDEETWVTPYPGVLADASPAARYESRESVELAFVAALQVLPGRQRAALLMRDVLGFSAAETAESLAASVASVNSALQRARRTLEARTPDVSQQSNLRSLGDARVRGLVDRLVTAWVDNDVDGLVGMLAEDVELTMPPEAAWYRGVGEVARFLAEVPMSGRLRWHAVPVDANAQVAFALWADSGAGFEAHSINVVTLSGDRIAALVAFRTPTVFAGFGLPLTLSPDS